MYTNMNLNKATKLPPKLFAKSEKPDQANFTPSDIGFKAQNPNLCYKNMYIEYYYLCL